MQTPSPPPHPCPAGHSAPKRRALLRLGAMLATAGLAGTLAACGGTDTEDPTVTLVAAETSAAAGESVTLIAVASSDLGISAVRFYRVYDGTSTLLATLNASPYRFTTAIPSDATGSISYYAQAVDDDGNTGDSNSVTVTISD